MKHTSYLLASIFFLISIATFANSKEASSSFFVKDGSLLVLLLAILAVFRISHILLDKE